MEKIKEIIENFISSYFEKADAKYAFIGVSGGIDSAVTLALTRNAIGNKRTIGIFMPESGVTLKKDYEDVKKLSEKLGVKIIKIDIKNIVNNFLKLLPFLKKDKISKANLKPRIRMTILYSFANNKKGLVVGSGDKSEFYLGYFTKWGDGAADIYPILDLYKTQVRELGKYLELPEEIIKKPSSPRLWKGQSAEKELGLSYEIIDKIIRLKIEENLNTEEISEKLNLKIDIVKKIEERIEKNKHKRESLIFPKINL